MTRTCSATSTASSLVHSPANLATPALSPTSPTLMSASPAAQSTSAPTAIATASKPARRTQIAKIGDERLRRSALLKRRHGLYKKATELATLCDCQVAILIFDSNDRLHHYSTTENVDDVLLRYASHYRPALDVRTAREYGGSSELGTRPSTTSTNVLGGNVDAPNPSTFVNQDSNVSNLLGLSPSDPTSVDADAMMHNLVDDDGDDDDLAMVTSPIFTPASAPADPFGQQPNQHQQIILSESGATFIQPSSSAVTLNRQLSGNASRRSLGIPLPTPLQIPMGQSPIGGGTVTMSPMSLPTQSPFFSAFDMMAINSPRMPASSTTPTDPTAGGSSVSRVPSSKKRRIDAVMHSDSAYVPNSPMFTPSLLASQPLPPLLPSVAHGHPANGGMSIDGTGSFASTSTSWLGGSGGTVGGNTAASPFQLPFTQTPTDMAADLLYSMPPNGTMSALPGTAAANVTQFMSPMTAATGTPMHGPMMTPLTIPSDTFINTASTQPLSSSGAFMPPPVTGFAPADSQPAAAAAADTSSSVALPATSGPLRLPPTRSLSAVFPDISLSEYLHAHPPHPVTGDSGEALMGTLAWDAQAEVVPPALPADQQQGPNPVPMDGHAGAAPGRMGLSASSPASAPAVAAHALAGQPFHPERVMSLDTILNAFSNTLPTTGTAASSAGQAQGGQPAGHQLQQASSIFDFESVTGGRCASPGGMVDDPDEMDEDVNLAPAAAAGVDGENESEEERGRKDVMAWPLLG